MRETRAGVYLSPRKLQLFDYIRTHPGMSQDDLASVFEVSKFCIRQHIALINGLFAATEIQIRGARGWGYRVEGWEKHHRRAA